MGTQGEFKEFAYTGSSATNGLQTVSYKYDPLYSLTNPPPPSQTVIISGSTYTGTWQQLYVVSASQFVALSGSLQGNVNGVIWPTGTVLVGTFTAVRLTGNGIVIASQGKNNI